MFVSKVNLVVFIFCCFFFQSRGLERLALENDDIILVTESIIINITSKLFKELHLKNVTLDSKLRRYIQVHNFLTSDALEDHKTLNEIVGLSRVDKNNADNETEGYVNILNGILNENLTHSHDSSIHNDDFIQYVDKFLTNFDGFKENNGIANGNYDSLEIKDEIIQILRSDNANDFNVSENKVTEAKKIEEDDNLLSDNEFWVPERPETRRIYHGTKTKIKYFPFMVSVLIFNSFQCAGSLVKSDLVITAASCVQLAWNNRFFRENPSFLAIRVGSTFYNGGGEKVPIMEVYFYPSYNPRNLRHNIVALRLLRKLKIGKKTARVKKIEIDRADSALPMNTDGITIVGWGATTASNIMGNAWSNRLSHAVLDVYHLQECQEVYSREYVTRTNFCAGFISKGGGACNHDVGGPGIVNGLLTGVISFGSPVCGTRDAPTVFTKVGFYAEWIDEIRDQVVPVVRKSTTLRPPPFVFTRPPDHLTTTDQIVVPFVTRADQKNPILDPETGTLRILENEDLLKEFLSTMFKSKEIDEYKDLVNNNAEAAETTIDLIQPIETKEPKRNINHVLAPDMPERSLVQYNTESVDMEEIDDIQNPIKESAFVAKTDIIRKDEIEDIKDERENYETEITTKKQMASKKYTVIDKNLIMAADVENDDKSDSLESDIVKLIDNVDISVSLTDQEISSGSKSSMKSLTNNKEANKEVKNVQLSEMHRQKNTFVKKSNTMQHDDKKYDDDIVTLLYRTDNEKDIGIFETNDDDDSVDDNVSEGMAIALSGFNDPTFRNNESASVLEVIGKNELYDLLGEAINEMTETKINK